MSISSPRRLRAPAWAPPAPVWRTGIRLTAGTTLASSLWWPWPWASSGVGSSLPGRRLADLALSGDAGAVVPVALGFGWYAVAAAGAMLVALAAVDGTVAAVARGVTVSVAVAAAIVVLGALGAPPWQFGPTAWAVMAALAAAATPSAIDLGTRGMRE